MLPCRFGLSGLTNIILLCINKPSLWLLQSRMRPRGKESDAQYLCWKQIVPAPWSRINLACSRTRKHFGITYTNTASARMDCLIRGKIYSATAPNLIRNSALLFGFHARLLGGPVIAPLVFSHSIVTCKSISA
jgi:hypothetical protein